MRYQAVKLGDGAGYHVQRHQRRRRLHRSGTPTLAEFNDSIFQNAPFSIIATDTRGLITAMNLAAERMTGYRREESGGQVSSDAFCTIERELAKAASGLEIRLGMVRG